jgi:quercetin dioxygenase-like cupin family protein
MPFQSIDDLNESEPFPGLHLRFVHSAGMTLAFWDIEAGAVVPEHSHPHEQIAMAIEGEFELVVGGVSRVMGPRDVAVIPSGTPHSGRAVTRCRMYDAFRPRREDFV